MALVRGAAVLHSVRFVRENYGAEAHERVLAKLREASWGTFHGPVREASWEPIADLLAYMVAAHSVSWD